MHYVILAAGLGSRFAKDGVHTPKPLVPVMGRPMIGRLIDILSSRPDCETIYIVANSRMTPLVDYLHTLRDSGKPLDVRPIISDNSYTSLFKATEGIKGKFVAMTVDAIFANSEFDAFVKQVEAAPEGEVVMALTRFVDDESPLYAKVVDGEVLDYHYGGEPYPEGEIVSAGIYGLTPEAMEFVAHREGYPESLSDFQRILAAESPLKVRCFEMAKALDVDSTRDLDVAEAFLAEANGEKPRPKTLKEQYRDSLKSSDTEEHIDLAFYRPIGFAWAVLFRRLGITPNAVTIASIFIGVAAGICFYPTALWINIIGMLLLIWANSYDSADGQLARMTKQYSRLGRILDGLSGDFWFVSIYIAICLRTAHGGGYLGEHDWIVWTLAILAGICHSKQAAVADYYRQFHLYFLKGDGGSELDSSAQVERDAKALSWSKNFWRKLVATCYLGYTRNQEAWTPAMQALRREMARRWPDGKIPRREREEFIALSRPLCKWENFMTFNWRTIFLFITLFVGQPWIYFVIELTVFNIVMLLTIRRHEHICRKFMADIAR